MKQKPQIINAYKAGINKKYGDMFALIITTKHLKTINYERTK